LLVPSGWEDIVGPLRSPPHKEILFLTLLWVQFFVAVVEIRVPRLGHLLGEETGAECKWTDCKWLGVTWFVFWSLRRIETKRLGVERRLTNEPTYLDAWIERTSYTILQRCKIESFWGDLAWVRD